MKPNLIRINNSYKNITGLLLLYLFLAFNSTSKAQDQYVYYDDGTPVYLFEPSFCFPDYKKNKVARVEVSTTTAKEVYKKTSIYNNRKGTHISIDQEVKNFVIDTTGCLTLFNSSHKHETFLKPRNKNVIYDAIWHSDERNETRFKYNKNKQVDEIVLSATEPYFIANLSNKVRNRKPKLNNCSIEYKYYTHLKYYYDSHGLLNKISLIANLTCKDTILKDEPLDIPIIDSIFHFNSSPFRFAYKVLNVDEDLYKIIQPSVYQTIGNALFNINRFKSSNNSDSIFQAYLVSNKYKMSDSKYTDKIYIYDNKQNLKYHIYNNSATSNLLPILTEYLYHGDKLAFTQTYQTKIATNNTTDSINAEKYFMIDNTLYSLDQLINYRVFKYSNTHPDLIESTQFYIKNPEPIDAKRKRKEVYKPFIESEIYNTKYSYTFY